MNLALRQLWKSPAFTLVALLTLALGIGVNTAAFSVLNRFVLQRAPWPQADRLAMVWATYPQWQYGAQSPGDFCDLRDQASSFEQLAAYYMNYQMSAAIPGKAPERATAMTVTSAYFSVLGVNAALGRTFSAEDEEQQRPYVILADQYWRKHFNADASVLGQALRLDGHNYTIVGVSPKTMDDPQLWGGKIDLWNLDAPGGANRQHREKTWYNVFGRLKPGVTIDQANAEVAAIGTRLAKDYPATNELRGQRAEVYAPDFLGKAGRQVVWLIMYLALAVLLIACVNLANLQLVRTTARAREFAIRLSLGASRSRLLRLVLTESLVLALAGACVGLLVAHWANQYLASFMELDLPLNRSVLLFTLATSLVTSLIFGLIPAWLATRTELGHVLKSSGRSSTSDRSRHRLRQFLIVGELSLALTLLAAAGFFMRGLQRITERDLGWNAENVLVGSFSLPFERYGDDGDERLRVFDQRFRDQLESLPGVKFAALSLSSPVWITGGTTGFVVEGADRPMNGQEPLANINSVSPTFFSAYGIPILQGRDFAAQDQPNSTPVALITQSLAQKFWPDQSAIGRRVATAGSDEPRWMEIIGVVKDHQGGADLEQSAPRYQIYTAWTQRPMRFVAMTLRTHADPRALIEPVRRLMAGIDADVAITQLGTATEFQRQIVAGFALVRRMLTQLAVIGVLLSAIGVYGVIANLTAERTQEVGVRMALGAEPGQVIWMFLKSGIRMAAAGTGLGLFCAFSLTHVLRQNMPIVPGWDPFIVLALSALLVFVTLLACWLPARRAVAVNPVIALRAE